MQKLKDEMDIEVEWIPFELHSETPIEGELLKNKFGSNIDNMLKMLSLKGKEFNINFENLTILSNSNRALKAAEYSKLKGKYEDFSLKLFKYYFEENKNIGDAEIINEIGKNAGLDIKEMNSMIDMGDFDENLKKAKFLAKQYNITSVPTFIINDKYKIVGAQPYEDIKNFLLTLKK